MRFRFLLSHVFVLVVCVVLFGVLFLPLLCTLHVRGSLLMALRVFVCLFPFIEFEPFSNLSVQ